MIEREHGVRLAATEVGLELHHRVAPLYVLLNSRSI